MTVLHSYFVDVLRQGTPVTGAILGTVMANRRSSATPSLSTVALYAVAGWTVGYGIRIAVLDKLGGLFHPSLPQNVAALRSNGIAASGQSAPPPTPAASPAAREPHPSPPATSPQHFAQAPPPVPPSQTSGSPDRSGNQNGNVQIQGTFFSDALGSL